MEIKGKTIFITGASSGIGLETAKELLNLGAKVINYSVIKLKSSSIIHNHNYLFIKGDIRSRTSIKRAIKKSINIFDAIDVLINNAAIVQRKKFIETNRKDWDRIIDINIKGTLNVTKEFILGTEKLNNKKMIINISSGSGLYGIEKLSIYSLTKAALINFSQSLQQEVADNIKVITITPGSTDTKMFRDAFPNKKAKQTPKQISKIIIKSIVGEIVPDNRLIIDVFKHTR